MEMYVSNLAPPVEVSSDIHCEVKVKVKGKVVPVLNLSTTP
jgi:hypothetical protein